MWELISINCRINKDGEMWLQVFWSCNQVLSSTDLIPSKEHENYKTYSAKQIIDWVKEILGADKVNKIEQGS
jgi:hypothetical protein